MPLSTQVIRVPVRLVNFQWELLYGGPVKVQDGAIGELHLERMDFTDANFLRALTAKRKVPVLPQDTELRAALTIAEDLDEELRQFLLRRDATEHDYTARINAQARFVPVTLGGPTEAQRRRGVTNGGLSLWLEGMAPRSIESGTVELPRVRGLESVDSLNHAFTRLSEVFEPWRKAHTGSIYERVFYREGSGIWYPLKDLRERVLAGAEREIIQTLWANVAAELGTQLF
jgi:hypothetical protein